MADYMSMQEFFYGESEPAYYGRQITSLPYNSHAHQTQPIPELSRRNLDLIMVPMKCENEALLNAMGSVNDVACDRYNQRETECAGYIAPAHALHQVNKGATCFWSGSSRLSGYEGCSYQTSRLVRQVNRDRRSYGEFDSREQSPEQRLTYPGHYMNRSDGYTRTFCPEYRSEAAITHYVSVHPTNATRVENMESC